LLGDRLCMIAGSGLRNWLVPSAVDMSNAANTTRGCAGTGCLARAPST
jgi:hypothetical protein